MAKIGNYVKVGVEGKFNVSPSSLGAFIDNPATYYRQSILGEVFEGNTNTVFGTVLHAALEGHFNGDKLLHSDVVEYLEQYKFNPQVDRDFILTNWGLTYAAAIAHGLKKPDKVEYQTMFEIDDKITLGGTVDYRRGKTIGDYKGCASIKKDLGDYKYQLMTYAMVEKLQGIETTHIEIVYIQRPNAGYPSEKTGKLIGVKKPVINVVVHEITDADWQEIEDLLLVVVDTLRLYFDNKELAHLIFRENKFSFRK